MLMKPVVGVVDELLMFYGEIFAYSALSFAFCLTLLERIGSGGKALLLYHTDSIMIRQGRLRSRIAYSYSIGAQRMHAKGPLSGVDDLFTAFC